MSFDVVSGWSKWSKIGAKPSRRLYLFADGATPRLPTGTASRLIFRQIGADRIGKLSLAAHASSVIADYRGRCLDKQARRQVAAATYGGEIDPSLPGH
jgi:hypothetical protein